MFSQWLISTLKCMDLWCQKMKVNEFVFVNYSLSLSREYLLLNDKTVYIEIIDDVIDGNFDLYRECDDECSLCDK